MKKSAWLLVLLLVGTLYFLSSIPSLQVLPLLRTLSSIMVSLDIGIVRLSHWLAAQVPLDFGELRHIDTLTRDFLAYTRENPVIIEFFLRKLAHIVVFFLITIALFFLFNQYLKRTSLAVLFAFLGGGTLAVLDEYRQSFVDGRVGSLVDVLIDMVGVALAIFFILFSLFLTQAGRRSLAKESKHSHR